MASLKSEFRKLLTVRSTYFITGFTLLLVTFLSVYVFGYQQAAQKASSAIFMSDTLYTMLGTFVTFAAIMAILLVAHEYRYGTIMYTLTSSTGRIRILFSKTIVMLTYSTVMGLLVLAIGYFGSRFGLELKGAALAPQNFPLIEIIWQYAAYVWGYTIAGILLAVLIRGLVGSIVAFFLIPTAEGILSLILKGNTKFLPFRSLDAIAATPVPEITTLGHTAALGVFSVYLFAFGTAALVLFVRRDAN